MKTVDELIEGKNFTAEEMEQLKDVIEECRQREAKLNELKERREKDMQGLSQSMQTFREKITKFCAGVEALCTAGIELAKTTDALVEERIKSVPEDQMAKS